jgi:uroporphyrinogen III methyltransferase/synthase
MLPLTDKTIVVTRPRGQAAELKKELEKLGARVVSFPTIEIVAPESYAELDAAIQNLADYDWLVVTSANTAEHFLRRLEANNLETVELDYLRVCAIGEATFERLRLAQIHVDLLPTESGAKAVFEAVCEYLGGVSELKDVRFLLPCSAIALDFLPKKLREAGAFVKTATAYQTTLPENPETGRIKALLEGGAIDCLTFTSPSTLQNFIELIGRSDLQRLLTGVAMACLGKTTAQAVRENELQVDIIAINANAVAFARAIAEFYQ